jgi:hypothetical protein
MNLGERIVLAARMAVAMHLEQSVHDSPEHARRITIGGTGLDEVKEDASPLQLDWARGLFPAPSQRADDSKSRGAA